MGPATAAIQIHDRVDPMKLLTRGNSRGIGYERSDDSDAESS